MFKNLFYNEETFIYPSVLLVREAVFVCVDCVCHTEILRVVIAQGAPRGPGSECR